MVMHSLPCSVFTRVCEGGGGELSVCLCVRSIHNIYEGMPENRAFKFNLLCQLNKQWKYPNLRQLLTCEAVCYMYALGDKRCVRHIQTRQVYYGLSAVPKRKKNLSFPKMETFVLTKVIHYHQNEYQLEMYLWKRVKFLLLCIQYERQALLRILL